MQNFQIETFPLLYGSDRKGIHADGRGNFESAVNRPGKLHLANINTVELESQSRSPQVSSFYHENQPCAIYSCGPENDDFQSCKLEEGAVKMWQSGSCDSSVRAIQSFCFGNDVQHLFQHERSVSVYSMNRRKSFSIKSRDIVQSASFSPMMRGSGLEELVILSKTGNVTLHRVGKSEVSFTLEEAKNWGVTRWSNHPRIFFIATRTGLLTVDLRSSDPVPNFHQFPNRLIYFDVESGSRFLCGFDDALSLYDERYIQRPLLKWSLNTPKLKFTHGGNEQGKFLCAVGDYGEIHILPYDSVSSKSSTPTAIPFPMQLQREVHDSWIDVISSISMDSTSNPRLLIGTKFGSIFKFDLSLQRSDSSPKIEKLPECFYQKKDVVKVKWKVLTHKEAHVHAEYFEIPRTYRDIKKLYPSLAREYPVEEDFIAAVAVEAEVTLLKVRDGCYSTQSNMDKLIDVDLERLSFLDSLEGKAEETDLLTQLSQPDALNDMNEERRETAASLFRDLVSDYGV